MDYHITLSPKVGIWTPMLHATLHKQWFTMPLANGKDKLMRPICTIVFNNTLTLPHNWIIRLNAQWYSKGAERNNYYYNADMKLDAAIQKDMPKQRLSFILNAVNVLRNSYYDITRYVDRYYQVSEGTRESIPRTVSFIVRYKL